MRVRSMEVRPGDHLVVCDVCGFTIWASESKKRWDGMIVCGPDYEVRHPQDFVRARQDSQKVEPHRPIPTERFLGTNEVTPDSL